MTSRQNTQAKRRISVPVSEAIAPRLQEYIEAHGRPSQASVARAALEWALNDPAFMARVQRRTFEQPAEAIAATAAAGA